VLLWLRAWREHRLVLRLPPLRLPPLRLRLAQIEETELHVLRVWQQLWGH
jgi:hypothetical protein